MEEHKNWQAKWIWSAGESSASRFDAEQGHDIVYFRRSFRLGDPTGCRLIVELSADSRYRLYMNGEPVTIGPCKGDRWSHYYDTVDLSDRLAAGDNVIAVKAVHYAGNVYLSKQSIGPASVWRSDRGAFLLNAELRDRSGHTLERLHSDEHWKTLRDRATRFLAESFTLYVGGAEWVDGSLIPHGWESSSFDDSRWEAAAVVSDTHDKTWGSLRPWQLQPRPIPPIYEKPRTFERIMRAGQIRGGAEEIFAGVFGHHSTVDPPPYSLRSPTDVSSVVVPPGETHWIELDAGSMTTGFLRLQISGGHDARIGILCSECYEYPPVPGGKRNKGVRDEWLEGKSLYGQEDVYIPAGTGNVDCPEVYEPFWHRAFRFVRLELKARDEPIRLLGFDFRDTGYPLEVKSAFACSDESLTLLWDISLNTLARCMHETYEDTPFYEQMQYVMDTRLQILFTYYVSGDDRLARKAIHDFHSSLLPSGMLQSRYPSVRPQIITGFPLFWVMIVHDHYLHFADTQLVARYRPTIDAVLDWFDRRIGPDGLVGLLPEAYWHLIDWVEEWKELYGAPPASRVGPLTVINLMYADALQKGAELNDCTGRACVAAEYRERAGRIVQAVRAECYSVERGLFRDGPNIEEYSQHAQIWSVLSGAVEDGEAQTLMKRTLAEPGLPAASIAYVHFLYRALARTGLYDHVHTFWDIWREQVDLHLTSWVEDPVSQRSDCHGWGAAPLYEFPAELLGVFPAEPGYRAIGVAPRPGPLQWAEGTVITRFGPVRVAWRIDGQGTFVIEINGPERVPVAISMPDGTTTRLPEAVKVTLSCNI